MHSIKTQPRTRVGGQVQRKGLEGRNFLVFLAYLNRGYHKHSK